MGLDVHDMENFETSPRMALDALGQRGWYRIFEWIWTQAQYGRHYRTRDIYCSTIIHNQDLRRQFTNCINWSFENGLDSEVFVSKMISVY